MISLTEKGRSSVNYFLFMFWIFIFGLIILFGNVCSAQDFTTYSNVIRKGTDAKLEMVKTEIIESYDVTPSIVNSQLERSELPPVKQYFYAGDAVQKTIRQGVGNYANSELLPDGRIQIFTGTPFVYDTSLDQWRSVENDYADPILFEDAIQNIDTPTLLEMLQVSEVWASETFNPTGDRTIVKGFCSSWAQCRDSGGPDYGCSSNTSDERTGVARTGSIWLNNRLFLTFDLTDITDDIATATFAFTTSTGKDGSPKLHLIPANSNSCNPNSFYDVQWTSFGYVNNPNTNTRYQIDLNQDGIDYLNDNKGGEVYFAMVEDHELIDTQPDVDAFQRITIKMSDTSGTENDPALILTLTESNNGTTTPPVDDATSTEILLDVSNSVIFVTLSFIAMLICFGLLYLVWPV